MDREAVETIIQEKIGPAFRRIGRPSYKRPSLEAINRIEFPRGFRFPEFTLFLGEENQSTVEHIGHFTIQCGEAVANEFLKLRLFANSLTGSAFSWYINLQPNLIHRWQELEQKFHEQFYRIEQEISTADLSRLRQMEGESVENFITWFKRARIRWHLDIPEREFVKLAQSVLGYNLRKKFDGTEFHDLFEIVSRASRYEGILKEDYQRKNSSRGSYYRDPNTEIYSVEVGDQGIKDVSIEIDATEVVATRPYVCKALAKPTRNQRIPHLVMDIKKNWLELEKVYSFDISKVD
ncbi:uncharacterized protein LOC132804980 [Ziziphus jujuba]|uniref:Uncharacterized protein LOC132804980 n=1 Tax=Ziziphus jujuba TaxID=326968 RepID=A0ABM4AFM0_ZIZJJ|nr:uncharacterized protein LOC132804980 [Ziziphus jujuba]